MSAARPYQVRVHNPHLAADVDESMLRRAVVETLQRFKVSGAELNIALLTDEALAELHRRHLGVDGPTDVLSFNLAEPDHTAGDSVEGDVAISIDTARRQALRRGHPPAAEMTLYAVHGVLHLLGLDDRTPAQARKMHSLENQILADLGLGRIYGD